MGEGGTWSPVCPHCHEIIWQAAPTLKSVRDFVARRRGATARELADVFGWSVANAHNKLAKLERLGVMQRDGGAALPSGGIEFTFRLTEL